jgi:hypothetical protein
VKRGQREGRGAVACYVTRRDAAWYGMVVFTHELSSLHPAQLGSLHPAQPSILHPAQLSSLHPAQLGSLHPAQLGPLHPDQLSSLHSAQLSSLHPGLTYQPPAPSDHFSPY